ncbi:cobalamin B12-binding domain-containing protein [Saccharomonospora iraqiensis]|uniref:cobalamin B12-binding domain-containing protein n=1 Tax=Saccharomonospora iraqiensis TaxID=52698 RepID=UPI0004144CA3|nr:cobalamin-dependent protein [Saccharomonospora iraqiensis]
MTRAVSGAGATDLTELVRPLERALVMGDTAKATAMAEQVLDEGTDPVAVLSGLLAPIQHRIGERWQRGEWSVAQEHIATGVSVAVTECVAQRVRRWYPVTRGRIVVGCPEREWHALPALMVGTALRRQGWEVTYLGAATPAERLSSYLQKLDPVAVAVSTSLAGGLPHARRFIEAATTVGVPVIAGGAAFGPDDARARALGATAWAASPQEAFALLEHLPTTVDPVEPLPAEPLAEQRALELTHHRLVERVVQRWRPDAVEVPSGSPGGTDVESDLASVLHDCVEQPLRTLQGALITGDDRLVREVADWARTVLVERQINDGAFADLGAELAAVLDDLPRARSLLERHWAA